MRTEIKSIAEQLSQVSSEEEARALLEANKDSLTEEDLQGLAGGVGMLDTSKLPAFLQELLAQINYGRQVGATDAIKNTVEDDRLEDWKKNFEFKSSL